jgi:GTP-binding protein
VETDPALKAKKAAFTVSASKPGGFPAQDLPEVAFAGRSNVGKSSLINALTGYNKLARTSNTPGRTRLINWFEVLPPKGRAVSFVDLPGYGYAKVSKTMRQAWRPLIESYLSGREVLRLVILLVDARRTPGDEERDFLDWLELEEVPVLVVMTKADKLAKSKRKPAALALKKELGLRRDPVPFSAHTGDGIDDLWRAIHRHVAD